MSPQTQPKRASSRAWRRTWQALVAVLVVLIGLYVFQYVTKGRFWQGTFERYVSKRAGRSVKVDGDFQLYLHPDIKFHADGLRVANPEWARDRQLFAARTIDLDVDIWKLLLGTQRITHLLIDGGRAGLERDAQGRNTWTFPGNSTLKLPEIDRADITDTRLLYIDALKRAKVDLAFGDVAATNRRIGAPLTFTGTGTAYDAPFTLKGALTTPDASIAGGRVGLTLHAEAVQTALDVTGTLPSATRIDGADLRFSATGRDMKAVHRAVRDLMPATSPGQPAPALTTVPGALPFRLKGSLSPAPVGTRLVAHGEAVETAIDFSGTLPDATRIDGADLRVTVAGRNLQAPGKLFGIVLPATRPYRLSSNLTKDGRDYRFTRIAGRIGTSDIGGNLRATAAADAHDKLRLNGTLSSRVLDILDVGPLIGYSPERLQAQGGKGAITIEAGRPRVLPDAPLAIEQLKAFDAHVDYSAATVRTGTVPIGNLRLGLYLEDRVLDLDPLAFDFATGRVTSAIKIDARAQPVLTDYDIRMSAVPIGKVLTSFKVEDSGTTATMRARIQLKGKGDSVRKSLGTATGRIALVFPRGTLWVRNIELAKLDLQNFVTALLGKRLKKPTELRCGVAAFTVTDGKAVADPVLFDTTRANYRMTGGFNFADESLNLSLQGDSKEFSLFSGQSPVGIKGWFAAPSIRPISGKLLARLGAGAGLTAVAGPIGAIAAFVDFGDAKTNDCTPILAAKTAKAVDATPKLKRRDG